MSTWVIDTSDQSAEGDGQDGTASVSYLISIPVSPAAIARKPSDFLGGASGSEPLPDYKSGHPEWPQLLLDRYTVTRDGQTSRAKALYSIDGRFTLPPIPDDDPDVVKNYGSGWNSVEVRVPYAKRSNALMPDTTAGLAFITYEEKDAWVREARQIPERRFVRTYEVLFKKPDISSVEAAIRAQKDKLHRIYGVWYHYMGSGVSFTGRQKDGVDLYSCTHTWTEDEGTPYPEATSALPGVSTSFFDDFYLAGWIRGTLPGMVTPPGVPGWLRPPFHSVAYAPSADITQPPIPYIVLDYKVGNRGGRTGTDGDGWMDLPGTGGL